MTKRAERRETGISLIGELPWGSHFCQFYQGPEDLLDILVPYFKAGLENNEFCLWITSEASNEEDALKPLHEVTPDFAAYATKGQMEIIPYSRWREIDSESGSAVISTLGKAKSCGFDGLRLACIVPPGEEGSRALTGYGADDIGINSVIAMFAYPRDEFDALGIMEVVKNHRFALIRNAGKWEVIEGSEAHVLREELKKSEELYRSLFENMLNGFAYCRILFEGDRPTDFTYLAVNDAFEKLTGLQGVVGKRVSEVIPGIRESDSGLLDTYGRVATTGVPERFEVYVDALKMWFSISVYSPKRDHFVAIFDVITERKRAEEALARAHEQTETDRKRLEAILETIPVGVVLIDSDNRFSLINRRAAEIYGADYDGFDLEDHIAQVKLLQPDGTPFPWEELPVSRARRGEASHNVEMSIVRANGVRVPIVVNTVPLRDAEGKVITAVVAFDDITERKRAEAALRESLERLEKVLEVETVGVMFWDLTTGCLVDANDAFLKLMGYSRSDVEARELTWQKFTPPEYYEVSAAEVRKFMATGRVGPYEKEYFRKDGTRQWLLFAGSSLGNNQCVEFCVDISDRKRAEQALRESEEQFRTLAESIPNLAWWANADGYITWYNQRWYDYTGTTPEQMEGWGWQSVHDPEVLPQVVEQWKESIATGKPFDMVFPLRGVDGVFRPFLTRVMPVFDQDGRIVRWFGTNTDISEQKRIEEALQKAHTELAQQMVERTRELHEKEVLLKEVHHRVKNNLQVISSLVGMQAEGTEDETVREVLQDVTYRVRSMALVHEKLYQSESLALIDFAEYARSLLHYLWRVHGAAADAIGLTLHLEPVSLPVDTAVPCGLILNELAGNALKHAFRGRSEGNVTVSLRRAEDGSIALSVGDNGVGLPAGDWRKSGSLGLRLVQMLAGQLRAEVVVGSTEGTKFTVTFRLKAEGKQELPSA